MFWVKTIHLNKSFYLVSIKSPCCLEETTEIWKRLWVHFHFQSPFDLVSSHVSPKLSWSLKHCRSPHLHISAFQSKFLKSVLRCLNRRKTQTHKSPCPHLPVSTTDAMKAYVRVCALCLRPIMAAEINALGL